MKVLIDPPKFDYTRFNRQIVKTETAGKLLNFYGDLIQHIELAIAKESEVKKIPHKVADIPTFKNLLYNKTYTNVFSIKLNNVHKLAEEFQAGMVYLEKLTLSNRSKWLKKNFKDEVKMFASTYKEVIVKSYFDMTDKHDHLKYDIIFNFNGVNPDNQGKFGQINQLTKQKLTQKDLMQAFQEFINVTEAPDMKIISKAQLLDLIEEGVQKKSADINENTDQDYRRKWKTIIPDKNNLSLFKQGRGYFPELQMKETLSDKGALMQHYFPYANKPDKYSPDGFIRYLKDLKLQSIFKYFKRSPAISNIFYPPNADTIYFNYFDTRVRLSDHPKSANDYAGGDSSLSEGLDVRVYWSTMIPKAIKMIEDEVKNR